MNPSASFQTQTGKVSTDGEWMVNVLKSADNTSKTGFGKRLHQVVPKNLLAPYCILWHTMAYYGTYYGTYYGILGHTMAHTMAYYGIVRKVAHNRKSDTESEKCEPENLLPPS